MGEEEYNVTATTNEVFHDYDHCVHLCSEIVKMLIISMISHKQAYTTKWHNGLRQFRVPSFRLGFRAGKNRRFLKKRFGF